MTSEFQKRGQKFWRRFSRASFALQSKSKEHIQENVLKRVHHIKDVSLLITEWILLITALIMLATAQTFWLDQTYSSETFVNGGIYMEATIGQVNSMNPLFAMTNSEKTLSRLMFSTLVTIDYSGNVGMGLADSLTPSENGKVWTLELKDNLVWSDGEPLTSDDVLFTLELIQNPATNTIYNANLVGVKITAGAEGGIIFTLPSAYADFATALEIPVVPKHKLGEVEPKTLVENEFSNSPVTSGAFMPNANQIAGTNGEEIIYLTANPNYYLGQPMLSSFAIHTYTDKSSLISAVNAGAVTATAEIDGAEANKVTSEAFVRRDSSVDSGAFAFFNTGDGALKDKALRAAIRQGIDLAIVREQAPDTTALNYPLIDSQIQLTRYPEMPSYNFTSARSEVKKIVGSSGISLNVVTVNSGYLPAVAEAFGKELASLDIDATVTVYDETQEFITNVVSRRDYDILIYEIELGAGPDLLPYYHSSQASQTGLNLSNYKNALVDDLLIGARETLDSTLRAKKYEAFLDYWVADVPAIALYQANMTYIYNKNSRAYGNDVRLVTALDRFSDVLNYATVKGSRYKTP